MRTILALNSGSSSLKFGLFRSDGVEAQPLYRGQASAIGSDHGGFELHDAQGRPQLVERTGWQDQAQAFARIAQLFSDGHLPSPDAIGHRLVHGGVQLCRHTLIDATVRRLLQDAIAFAPLHLPAALAGIDAMQAQFPQVPQVACLDTAFHADLPAVAATLPIAHALSEQGLRRFGFHGLSCESIVHQLGDPLPPRLVIAHLGNGSSVTAVRAGRSIDTSMGLTPSGGVMMATRSGDLDPGLLAYLVRERGFGAAALEDLIDRNAGMLGVSGLSGDMQRLRHAAPEHPRARLAIDMFCHSVCKHVAGLIAVLGGLDLLVFTGGIGEHDRATRAGICRGLACFGVASEADGPDTPPSAVPVRVQPSQEAEQIARHTARLST